MLSILIPTYNYNVFPLVSELRSQCEDAGIRYEIVILDDGSELYHQENNTVNALENCAYEVLPKNIGRSAIRNLLAKKARFDFLLFLDADVFPTRKNFISTYISHLEKGKMTSGGLAYKPEKPGKNLALRWTYGMKREALSAIQRAENPYVAFLASNFIAPKSLFDKVPFDENIPDLRREDTLFSYTLMTKNIPVTHVDNPVFHLGIDSFKSAIRKERESLDGLKYMLNHQLLPANYLKISRLFMQIKNLRLTWAVASLHEMLEPLFLKNLASENPSLRVFDLYRIGYLFREPKR